MNVTEQLQFIDPTFRLLSSAFIKGDLVAAYSLTSFLFFVILQYSWNYLDLHNSLVTKAWGYFLWSPYMDITSSGQESSPRINFGVTSNSWYKLKSVVNGTNVKVYVNDNLAKEIKMSGSEADSKSNNYVGIWCHARIPIKGDSFHVAGEESF